MSMHIHEWTNRQLAFLTVRQDYSVKFFPFSYSFLYKLMSHHLKMSLETCISTMASVTSFVWCCIHAVLAYFQNVSHTGQYTKFKELLSAPSNNIFFSKCIWFLLYSFFIIIFLTFFFIVDLSLLFYHRKVAFKLQSMSCISPDYVCER